jgi:multidrug efflux pump
VDTGAIRAISEGPQSISFAAMAARQALAKVVLEDPAVAACRVHRRRRHNVTLNSGRMLINLKPRAERSISAVDVIRLQPKLANVEGVTLYMPTGAGPVDRGPRQPYAISIHRRVHRPEEVGVWVHKLVDRLQQLPRIATWRAICRIRVASIRQVRPGYRSRLGLTPAAIDSAQLVRATSRVDDLRNQSVSRRARGEARIPAGPVR